MRLQVLLGVVGTALVVAFFAFGGMSQGKVQPVSAGEMACIRAGDEGCGLYCQIGAGDNCEIGEFPCYAYEDPTGACQDEYVNWRCEACDGAKHDYCRPDPTRSCFYLNPLPACDNEWRADCQSVAAGCRCVVFGAAKGPCRISRAACVTI